MHSPLSSPTFSQPVRVEIDFANTEIVREKIPLSLKKFRVSLGAFALGGSLVGAASLSLLSKAGIISILFLASFPPILPIIGIAVGSALIGLGLTCLVYQAFFSPTEIQIVETGDPNYRLIINFQNNDRLEHLYTFIPQDAKTEEREETHVKPVFLEVQKHSKAFHLTHAVKFSKNDVFNIQIIHEETGECLAKALNLTLQEVKWEGDHRMKEKLYPKYLPNKLAITYINLTEDNKFFAS